MVVDYSDVICIRNGRFEHLMNCVSKMSITQAEDRISLALSARTTAAQVHLGEQMLYIFRGITHSLINFLESGKSGVLGGVCVLRSAP